jgi:hypothetical protein
MSICSYRIIRTLSETEVNSRFKELYNQVCFLSTGGASAVSSVFGRSGVVSAQSGDYTFAQISSTPTTVAGYGITDAVSLTGSETLTNKTLTSPTLTTPVLGTPSSGNLSNCTAYPATALSGLGSGVAVALGTAVTGSTSIVLATSPTLVTPLLGTPTSGNLANCTGYPVSSLGSLGTGVATALAVNVGSAGAFVTFNGALGTPSSGTLTSCTGLPVSTGISGLGTGVATALAATPSATGGVILFAGATGAITSNATANNSNFRIMNDTSTGTSTQPALLFGSGSTVAARMVMMGSTNPTLTVNHDYAAMIIGNQNVTEAGSGTHSLLVGGLAIKSSVFTNGAGATTNTASLYINDAPSGLTPTGGNYGIFVDAGLNRFDGNTSIGTGAAPTAQLTLGAGTTAASTAPLKFTSGTNQTTGETGAVEYDGTNLTFVRTGTTRETVVVAAAVNSVSPTSPNRTVTINIGGTTYYLAAKTTND